MEGYHGDIENDKKVPSDKEAWIRFQSIERCMQWGVNAEDSFGSVDNSAVDEGDVSCETLIGELEMSYRVGEEDDSDISEERGGIPEYSNCWTTFLNGPDIQVDGFPGTIQTDDNFVNSMLLDDVRVGEKYQRTYSTANNMDGIEKSHKHFKSAGLHNLFNWDKESGASHQNLLNSINHDAHLHNASLGSTQTFASIEELALQNFGKAMDKMTGSTRLCFRDALYRLAGNTCTQSGIEGQHGDECASETPYFLDQPLRTAHKDALESKTKAIDVTIANLLFNKAY